MSARAGIVITGTEVLSGRIADRNGPWLAERLAELGVDLVHMDIVGDRRADILAALRFLAGEGLDLVVTTGGLGPTADDLTVEVVAAFSGRELVLDAALERRIGEILRHLVRRYPDLDQEALRASNRKQAIVPRGATVLDPVGTAPGLVVPPSDGEGPTVVVLPGPPRELQPMWPGALATPEVREATAGGTTHRQETLRLFGIPESEIASTLRALAAAGLALDRLEITTCLRRGEIEVVTRFLPSDESVYARLVEGVRERHAKALFSEDGATVDEQVATLLADSGRTIAVCESCTGGLLAGRLTDLAGSSGYFLGAIVAYANEAKTAVARVDRGLVSRHGAVSAEVAGALADAAVKAFGADLGVGVTGVAGPGGGTAEKPVGLVHLSVAEASGARLTRELQLPGSRADVRERATTVALHLVRRLLLGESDPA